MIQQVNLYTPELRPKKEWLNFNVTVMAIMGLIFLLVLLSFADSRALAKLEAEVIAKENQKVATQEQLTKIKSVPRVSDENQINEKLAVLRNAVKSRKQIGLIIESENLGNEKGFSAPLMSLARQSISDISLNKIRMTLGGHKLELNGETRSPEAIASYIQKLQNDAAFVGVQFGALTIAGTIHGNIHQFSLGFDPVYTEGSKK